MRARISTRAKVGLAGSVLLAAVGCGQESASPTPIAPTPVQAPTRRVAQGLRATPGGVDILTYHGNAARTGWNRRETTLTLANVRPETFGQVAQAREVEGEIVGQPLFLSNHLVHDVRTNTDVNADVLYVATMDDHVYALDAENLEMMWHFDFEGRRAPSASDVQACQSPYHLGVQSTPVISPDKTLMYVVGRVVGTTPTDTWLQGYVLRTRDGTVAARFRVGETVAADGTRTPIHVDANDRGNMIRIPFNTTQYTQRGGLLLVGDYLYLGTGGICDVAGFRGWFLAYDVRNLTEASAPAAAYVPTPGGGGGIWSAGGPASDGRSIFVSLGNGRAAMRAGTPEPMRSVSDGLVRLDPMLRLDRNECFNIASPTAACGPADATNLRNVFMPRHAELLARDNIADMDPANDLQGPDEDFGSSGPLLVPPAELPENMGVDMGHNLAAVGGKDGFFYLIDRDRMGGQGPSPLTRDMDIPNLVGAELWSQELYLHSTSGGIRASAAYFEGHGGRYLYIVGADEIGGRADSPRGLAALRLRTVTDPTPEACAAQFRQIAYQLSPIPCATIWGSTPRPGFELAWSGNGPTTGASAFVSSNGHDQGIVWVTFERVGDTNGLLEAFPADLGPGSGRVVPPLYRSDRVEDDHIPGQASTFAGPIVANGRVYITAQGVSAYGLIPARAVPPIPETPPPPNCAPGVSWEADGQPFMNRYCTACHAEYRDLGFIQRRHDRVAASLRPLMGDPTMPLVRDASMPPPIPTDEERTRIGAWLRCGAPAAQARVHAGYETIAAAGGPFVGDGDSLDPNRTGTLSNDRLVGARLDNPFSPLIPNALFAVDRTGPTRYRIPVPGAGRYSVAMYFAENACTSGGSECSMPFDVSIAGRPWLSQFDIYAAAGASRRVVTQTTVVDVSDASQLAIDVGANGKVHALEVVRRDMCTGESMCTGGFVCVMGACVPPAVDGGPPEDAGEYDSSLGMGDGAMQQGDGGTNDGMGGRGCGCRTQAVAGGHNALAGIALAGFIAARRRRRTANRSKLIPTSATNQLGSSRVPVLLRTVRCGSSGESLGPRVHGGTPGASAG